MDPGGSLRESAREFSISPPWSLSAPFLALVRRPRAALDVSWSLRCCYCCMHQQGASRARSECRRLHRCNGGWGLSRRVPAVLPEPLGVCLRACVGAVWAVSGGSIRGPWQQRQRCAACSRSCAGVKESRRSGWGTCTLGRAPVQAEPLNLPPPHRNAALSEQPRLSCEAAVLVKCPVDRN